MRVLVIDDNPDDRQLVRREVEVLFPLADVVEPSDMTEFNAALDAGSPDLAVTDLDIHWTNGGVILSTIKARYPDCPVVMFTGTGDEEIAVELMKAGLNDYVVKSSRQLPRLRTSLKLAVDMARSRSALSEREAQLMAMVTQRDVIVRELHHRVKNNLQTTISLLQVRGRQVDEATRQHFDDIAGRISVLGAVQSRIYEVGNLDQVEFSAVLSDLLNTLCGIYSHTGIDREFDGHLHLDVGRATPLALLCYELILNALKHAWPGTERGKLTAEIRTKTDPREITLKDDGVGFIGGSASNGLGTRLVRSLAEEANIEIEIVSKPGGGTIATLKLV